MNGARDGNRNNYRGIESSRTARAVAELSAVFGGVTLVFSQAVYAGIELKSYRTHTHVSVAVDPGVDYQIEKIEEKGKLTGLRLVLDNVREDLDSLAGRTDDRTASVKMLRTQGGGKVSYEFLLNERARIVGVEYFDYRNKAPAEISLDYWLRSQKLETREPAKSLTVLKAPVGKKHVKPVVAEAAASNGCEEPLNFAVDGGAYWKVYHRPYDYTGFFDLMPADARYEYPFAAIKSGERLGDRSKEVAHYRLALKLHKEGKYALSLRTIEFFGTRYPKSDLNGELEFLRASTLIQLSRLLRTERYMEQAIEIYKNIVRQFGETERGRLSLAFVVQQLMQQRVPVLSLEYALAGAELKPRVAAGGAAADMSPWVYRLASAEALFALGENDRAERAYQLVIDQDNGMSPEAAFRIGEVHSARRLWERAILAYERAIRRFSADADRFPTAWFNLAEAYFRLDNLVDAERVYREFSRRFPSDGAIWAAQLRLAELGQMRHKAASAKERRTVASAYEDVVNRYPYSPGAVMAEYRLARCLGALKTNDRTRQFFEGFFARRDLKKAESPLVDPREIELWADLTEARFHVVNSNYRAALARSDDYRSRLDKIPLGKSFRDAYAKAAVGLVEHIALTESAEELLSFIERYGDFAPTPAPVGYLIAIAKAEQAKGEVKAAGERLTAVEVRLREATDVEKDLFRLLKARQFRTLGENPERVILELSQIRDSSSLAPVKYEELSRSAAEKGDYRASAAYDGRLLDTQLSAGMTIDRQFEVAFRRLESVSRFESPAELARQAQHVLLKYGAQTQAADRLARVSDMRAQALYDSGNFKGAVAAIEDILGAQPSHPRRSEFEFMRGKGLTKLGRDGEAVEAFRQLAQAAKDDVWKKSAQAELDQVQWENNVEKQLKETGGL